MFLQTEVPPATWDSTHRKILADFLDSEVGKLAIQWVAFHAPVLLDGDHVNKSLVASGAVRGYAGALNQLFSLTRTTPAEIPSVNPWPDIDNEAAWNGDKPK
jgi:hypothetical protein